MKQEKWVLTAQRFGIDPVTARLIRNRDITDLDEMRTYLYGRLSDLPDPALLKDALKGAQIMKDKIESGRRIRIISDYDVDGVSSNYILYLGLKRCGALVDYRIPDRVEDGYGINENLIRQAFEDGIDTIITCDNDIAAEQQIDYGNSLGMTFIVTDHHDVPFEMVGDKRKEKLPAAAAVINPKQADCPYPHKNICGAVVAWTFIKVLYRLYGIAEAETEDFLEIAALATVCDVMPLQGENRIIVKEGLARMNHTKIPGLLALIEGSGLQDKEIRGYHLGFIIGPCINASGRLSTARLALELLLCRQEEECRRMAGQLISLNAERKEMTRKGEEQAKEYLVKSGHDKDKVLIVYLPDCHESIAGIIAGRIRETYNKPVFVLTRTMKGVKGSGRSIDAYHMYQEMSRVRECFDQFGGHPMAAGLSMQEERIEELRQKLNANTTLTEADFVEKVNIDIALPFDYISEELIRELDLLEPFGTGNEKPLFAQKDLEVSAIREQGRSGRVLKLFLKDRKGYPVEAIWFGDVAEFYHNVEECIGSRGLNAMLRGQKQSLTMACTYYPQINEWRGQRTIQIVIKNYMLFN